MKQKKYTQNNFLVKDQAGVTLLLSVLMLSAITAISFSLATIAFVEIRASSDVARSEPALYVTQGQIEEAIFKVKRQVPDSDSRYTAFNANFGTCTTDSASLSVNTVRVSSKLCDRNLDNVHYATVTLNNRDELTTPLKRSLYFPLVDPATFNDTPSASNSYPASYSRVIFKYASPATYAGVRIYICKELANPNFQCTDNDGVQSNGDYITPSGGALLTANTMPNTGTSDCRLTSLSVGMICYELDPETSYALFLQYDYYNPTTLPAKFANIQIKTCGTGTGVDTDCSQGSLVNPAPGPRGLYFPGKKTVDISAVSAGNVLTRKYRVFIPE